MKLYIPSVGDQIRLLSPWEFTLHPESRNNTLFEFMEVPGFDPRKWKQDIPPTSVTIPSGEVLKVDRIYIRKGKDEFDSVTFMWKGKATKGRIETYGDGWGRAGEEYKIPRSPVRFWAKLPDVNKIEFEPL